MTKYRPTGPGPVGAIWATAIVLVCLTLALAILLLVGIALNDRWKHEGEQPMVWTSLLAMAGAAKAISSDVAQPAKGNEAAWITNDDYPPEAIRAGQEGTVEVRITIDRQGKVSRCVITKSSGAPVLDDATCHILVSRASYVPARNAKGNAVEDVKTRRVAWALPEDQGGNPLTNYAWALVIHIAKDGSVAGCESVSSGRPLPQSQESCDSLAGALRPALDAANVDAKGIVVRLKTVQSLFEGQNSADQTPDGYRVLKRAQTDFTVLTDGRASDCRIASGPEFVPPFMHTPCADNATFFSPTNRPLTQPVSAQWVETISYRPETLSMR